MGLKFLKMLNSKMTNILIWSRKKIFIRIGLKYQKMLIKDNQIAQKLT